MKYRMENKKRPAKPTRHRALHTRHQYFGYKNRRAIKEMKTAANWRQLRCMEAKEKKKKKRKNGRRGRFHSRPAPVDDQDGTNMINASTNTSVGRWVLMKTLASTTHRSHAIVFFFMIFTNRPTDITSQPSFPVSTRSLIAFGFLHRIVKIKRMADSRNKSVDKYHKYISSENWLVFFFPFLSTCFSSRIKCAAITWLPERREKLMTDANKRLVLEIVSGSSWLIDHLTSHLSVGLAISLLLRLVYNTVCGSVSDGVYTH